MNDDDATPPCKSEMGLNEHFEQRLNQYFNAIERRDWFGWMDSVRWSRNGNTFLWGPIKMWTVGQGCSIMMNWNMSVESLVEALVFTWVRNRATKYIL